MYEEDAVMEESLENAAVVSDAEISAILAEYNHKQLIENMTGPGVSFVFHLVFLLLMFLFIVSKPKNKEPDLVVQIVPMEEIELEPEVKQEIVEIEKEDTTEDAPVNTPEAPSSTVGATDSMVDVDDNTPSTDDNIDQLEVCDTIKTTSVLTYTGPLGGRTPGGMADGVRKYGGGKPGQEAVNKALRWLAKVQNANGSWGNESPAHTGIALLVFLAHGETPLSEKYGITVQNAMRWLANYATDEQTMRSGISSQKAYGHGIATYAIAESYAMTKIPFMQTAMERAVDVIIKGQQAGGGFDYKYAKGGRWDMSVSGWQFQALKSARVAGSTNEGLKEALEKSIKFMRQTAYANYTFGYNSPGGRTNLTGAGVVGLQLLGAGQTPEAQGGLSHINEKRYGLYKELADNPASWSKASGESLYGWYYDTQAVFNALVQDTDEVKANWKAWRAVFENTLVRAQNREGYWETTGHIGGSDIPGRVLATCFCALQLEVYYRYLPSFDIKKMEEFAAQDAAGGIDTVGTGDGLDVTPR